MYNVMSKMLFIFFGERCFSYSFMLKLLLFIVANRSPLKLFSAVCLCAERVRTSSSWLNWSYKFTFS